MKFFFLRILPFLVGALVLGLSFWQWSHPLSYPTPLLLAFFTYTLALVLVAWKQQTWQMAVDRIIPSLLAFASIGFGFLMIHSAIERMIVSLCLAGIAWLTLELFFLLTRAPSRYPVNGLSRVNVALAPVSAFFLAMSLHGLRVFLGLSFWVAPVLFFFFVGLWFYLTSHPSSTPTKRVSWSMIGGLVGLHIGFLALVLPVGHGVYGALAALLLALPLRIRRYSYDPRPSRRHAWVESGLAIALFAGIVVTSRWV